MPKPKTRPNDRQIVVAVSKAQRIAKRMREEGVSMTPDRMCEWMVMWGFSNRAIRNKLKLTDYQITKIQKEAKIRKADYRDMLTPVAKAVVQRLDALSERRLVEHVEKYLLK